MAKFLGIRPNVPPKTFIFMKESGVTSLDILLNIHAS